MLEVLAEGGGVDVLYVPKCNVALWLGYGGLQGYFSGDGVVVRYSDVVYVGVCYCNVCDDQVQCVSPIVCGDIHELLKM